MSVKRFDQFEQQIKDALNSIQPKADQSVWQGIKADMATNGGSSAFNLKSAGIIGVVASVVVISSLAFFGWDIASNSNEAVKVEEGINQTQNISESQTETATESISVEKTEAIAVNSAEALNLVQENTVGKERGNQPQYPEEVVQNEDLASPIPSNPNNAEEIVALKQEALKDDATMIEVSTTKVCQGTAIECRTLNGKSAVWDMGDGNKLEGYRIMYHYLRAGDFSIQAYQEGEGSELRKVGKEVSVSVFSKPNSGFEVYAANDLNKSATDFKAHESFGTHVWRFGNGISTNGTSASHRYKNKGYYQVKHIVFSAEGCADSSSQNIRIAKGYNLMAQTVFNPSTSTWLPKGLKEEGLTFEIRVFDLNGRIAFVSTNPENVWEGKSQSGKEVSEGAIFYWVATVSDAEGKSEEYGGNILIINH